MDRTALYLRIPWRHFAQAGFGLRWSADGEAVEFADGRTFAFSQEAAAFMEGFAAQRPLIHFGYILQLLWLLRLNWLTPADPKEVHRLHAAFCAASKPYRNAGVFFAACVDIPAAADPPSAKEVEQRIVLGMLGALLGSYGSNTDDDEKPPLDAAAFEAKVLGATAAFDNESLWHWFRHGRGPLTQEAATVAEAVRRSPRMLTDALDETARHRRLAGSAPFVEQLTAALALPPRRLARPETPLGGYADVTTRGGPEQILPSQFALDELEFVRRYAEKELLYYRREEPHDRTRENVVVLLDQGVRTWGSVRLVLAAAVFALGRLAGARRLPFMVAATHSNGVVHDPLEMTTDALVAFLEASDLSADPGAALERVLEEEIDSLRDVVLLTHPRNLGEEAVRNAARLARPRARLFAVAVDDRGDVEFSELRRGAAVRLSRFHIDLSHTAPPPPDIPEPQDVRGLWHGDVEAVPSPFVFGVGRREPFCFDFDLAGERLVTATANGVLHATSTNGSGVEVLPRAVIDGCLLTTVQEVRGVAGGVVVLGSVTNSPHGKRAVVAYYDFTQRTCTGYSLGWLHGSPWRWFYFRDLHSVAVVGAKECRAVDLASGGRILAAGAPDDRPSRAGEACDLAQRRSGKPGGTRKDEMQCHLETGSGEITLEPELTSVPWKPFIPMSEGEKVLRGARLLEARCRGWTLGVAVVNRSDNGRPGHGVNLHLFRGPEGTPLAVYPQAPAFWRFTLSDDGRLLARQIATGQLEVREVGNSGPPLCTTRGGGFHKNMTVILGDRCLLLRVRKTFQFLSWDHGRLTCLTRKGDAAAFMRDELVRSNRAWMAVEATKGPLPDFVAHESARFVRVAQGGLGRLIALVDEFGQTALFEREGRLICMFFALGGQLAAWAPPDVRYGPASLLGAAPTPGADEQIGRALLDAWQRAEPRSP
jgi:hypothetical protein